MMNSLRSGSFVAGFMLGALLIGLWAANTETGLPFTFASSPAPKTATTTPQDSGAIAVQDQAAGSSVTVESLTVPPPGVWIAVREVNAGELGNVLGAERVNGPRTDIEVSLLRATEPGRSYAVELYRDDGGATFDLASDSVYIDFATSASVIAYFTTTN